MSAPGFPTPNIEQKGARIARDRAEVFHASDVILQVARPGANPEGPAPISGCMRSGQVVIGFGEPLNRALYAGLAERGVTFFAMELMPRITRAQSMDALSSMATIAGYKAVLLAADALPRMFPMLMTAAGTVAPARVLRDRRGRRRTAGDRHRAPPGRRGQRLRRPRRRQGAGREPGRALRRARRGSRAAPKTRAATPRRWTRSSTAGSASCWRDVLARAGRRDHHRRRARPESARS